MKKLLFFAVLAGIAVTPYTVEAKTIEIKMLNMSKDGPMAFEPGFVKADIGDTVKFIAQDKSHNSESVVVPAGAKAWKGKTDENIEVKLDKEGVYVFQCMPHATMAMAGVIQVGKATNLADAKKQVDSLSSKFVMNKDRLKKYLGQAN